MPGKAHSRVRFVWGSLFPSNPHLRAIPVAVCQLLFSVPHNCQQSKHLAAEEKPPVRSGIFHASHSLPARASAGTGAFRSQSLRTEVAHISASYCWGFCSSSPWVQNQGNPQIRAKPVEMPRYCGAGAFMALRSRWSHYIGENC